MIRHYSSIAQSVEHAAVNRGVVGSSPTRGAILARWSSGQDTALSRREQGFDSLTGHHLKRKAIAMRWLFCITKTFLIISEDE